MHVNFIRTMNRLGVMFVALVLVVSLIIPVDAASTNTAGLSVLFIDCGQGDATLIGCDGQYMLIDGGSVSCSQLMYTILKDRNIQQLEYIVATHPHEDHVGGLPGALNFASAKQTFCSTTQSDDVSFAVFAEYASKNGGGITVPNQGECYHLGSAEIQFLGQGGNSNDNDNSLITKVTYGSTSFLFVGDAGSASEQQLLSSGMDIKATVLKVGHHGAREASTADFLQAVQPEYAVISVGTGNSYGHPTEETLTRLYEAQACIFRTDLHGDVEFLSDGSTITIYSERTPKLSDLFKAGDPSGQEDGTSILPIVAPAPAATEAAITEPTETTAPGIDYVGNLNSMTFHYAFCKSVDKMKDKNKFCYNGTREDMLAKGFKPCGSCKP